MAADLTVKDSAGVVHTIRFGVDDALPQGRSADTLRADFFTKETKGAPSKIVVKKQFFPDKPIDLEKLMGTTAIERQLRDSYASCDPLSHIICFLGVAGDAAVKARFNGPDFYSIDDADDQIYLLYRYIKGVDFNHFRGDFTTKHISQIVMAVKQIHAAGIIHRDIKPDNIMIGEDGIVRLIDFGSSCRQADFLKNPSGTPYFLSPEAWVVAPNIPPDIIGKSEKRDLIKADVAVDARCVDVFAVGATLFYILTKKQFTKHVYNVIKKTDPNAFIKLASFMIQEYSTVYEEVLDSFKPGAIPIMHQVINLIKSMVHADYKKRFKLEEYTKDLIAPVAAPAAAVAAPMKGNAMGGAGGGAGGGPAVGGTRRVLKKNRKHCHQSKRNYLQ